LGLRARDAKLSTTTIPIRFDGAPWTLARLAWFFRRRQVQAVLCNLTKDLKMAGVAARLVGIRTILALRESDFPLKNKLYYRWFFNRVASGVVVNSEATGRTVLGSVPWLDPQRVHILHKGVDLQRFRPRGHHPDVPTVGFVGQLIERKGLTELMAAWSQLETERWAVPPLLRLAGTGPLADRLQRWRQGLNRPEAVFLQGYVEPIEHFLAGLSVLVLPSRAEGFGLAGAEAAASGLPVVATRTSSLPEIVLDGQTGILVPPKDPEALAAALRRLLTDGPLGRRLGQAGRQLIARRFSRERMLDGLQALVESGTGP
jgi:glycosyltransferase involved in cell wall biosynthesis